MRHEMMSGVTSESGSVSDSEPIITSPTKVAQVANHKKGAKGKSAPKKGSPVAKKGRRKPPRTLL